MPMQNTDQRIVALDAARGYCLVIMTLDHLPDHVFSRFSNAQFGPFGFFTAASLFVFLSGIVSARSYGRTCEQAGWGATWRRVGRRMLQLYAANTAVLLLLLAGVVAGVLRGSFWDREFAQVIDEPVAALLKSLALLYRPGYTDILPMYIVFLAAVPPMLWGLRRGGAGCILILSAAIWLLAQFSTRTGPLNPLGYQLPFVLGFVLGGSPDTERAWLRTSATRLLHVALLAVAALALVRVAYGAGLWSLPTDSAPWRAAVQLENNGPLRLLNFVLFVFVVAWAWRNFATKPSESTLLFKFLAYLGRNSLAVFSWSVLTTYLSIATMPPQPDRVWRLLDAAMAVGSLGAAAALGTRLPKVWYRAKLLVRI